MKSAIPNCLGRPRRSHGLEARVTVIFLVLTAFLCGGCGAPSPGSKFVDQAERLHREAFAPAVTTDSDLREYVQLVGKRVMDAAHEVDANRTRDPMFSSIQFHLVGCDVPNALTTGGSHIYLYNGLFQYCQSEDELAAAIAHTCAHAVNLDLEHIDLRPDPNTPLPLAVWDLANHRYTAQQERTADRLAFEIYLKAGYDAQKFTSLLEHLADRYTSIQAPDRAPMLTRIQEIRALGLPVDPSGKRPLPVADPKTFDALRRQAASLKQDQVPQMAQVMLSALPNCMLSGDTPEQDTARQQLRPLPPPKRLEPS
jgi:predicted Zn-dependent protease